MKVKVFEKVKEYKPTEGPSSSSATRKARSTPSRPTCWSRCGEIHNHRRPHQRPPRRRPRGLVLQVRHPPAVLQQRSPLTLVIARYDLLDILRNAVGEENIMMQTVVEKYENAGDKVVATLTDGTTHEGRTCSSARTASGPR